MKLVYSTNILLWNGSKELLVVSRKDANQQFALPGGKVDLCDYDDYFRTNYYKRFELPPPDLNTLRRCASRELKEECDIYVRPDDLQPVFTGRHGHPSYPDTECECTSFWAMCKKLPDPRPGEPGTWVGWRTPEQLLNPKLNPFADLVSNLFEAIGVR